MGNEKISETRLKSIMFRTAIGGVLAYLLLFVSIPCAAGGGYPCVTVNTSTGRVLAELKVYAFNEEGAYTGKYAVTDIEGSARFSASDFEEGAYRFRVDYLGSQFWSHVINLPDVDLLAVTIPEEATTVRVSTATGPAQGVRVYLFSESGTYLGIYGITDENGEVTFHLPVGILFTFRADILGNRYWSEATVIQGGGTNAVSLDAGGGHFQVTLQEDPQHPIPGVRMYLFKENGNYLGEYQVSDAEGLSVFEVSEGTYKIRADYLGYAFWTDSVLVTTDTHIDLTVPHQDVTLTLSGVFQGAPEPVPDVRVYLFKPSGAYQGQYQVSDENGRVRFHLPERAYKVRADYLGMPFWSEDFIWADTALQVPMAEALITVTGGGFPQEGEKVYVFSPAGAYLGLCDTTDAEGRVMFRLAEGVYKFRTDHQGSRFWSEEVSLTAHEVNPVDISVGGGAFTVTVRTDAPEPLAGVKCYVFDDEGTYIGLYGSTDADGVVSFDLADGAYTFRMDYLGHSFWSHVITVPDTMNAEVVVEEEAVEISVGINCGPAQGVRVYLFSGAGVYLGLYQEADSAGMVGFTLPVGKDFSFRVDILGNQYWSGPVTVEGGGTNFIAISAGGGTLQLTLRKGPDDAMPGIKTYLFNEAGTYLGLSRVTDESGIAVYDVPKGTYKVCADYLGYPFWSDLYDVPSILSENLNIPHQDVTVAVEELYQAASPIEGVKVYLFIPSGAYQNRHGETDGNGRCVFSLPDREYKVRADYLGHPFWSERFQSQDITLTINQGLVRLHVYSSVTDVEGAKVYLFSEGGTYLGKSFVTDANGHAEFLLPDRTFKFRVDQGGEQHWSPVVDITAGVVNDVEMGVSVIAANISANPETIEEGATSTLSWSTAGADSAVIDPDIGGVNPSGSTTVSPAGTTTYIITATGPEGTATDSVTVTVTHPQPTVNINADPESIQSGESSTLTWVSTFADSVGIEPDIGHVSLIGSVEVSPVETTTYTITATGSLETTTDSVTVTVDRPPSITLVEPDGEDDTSDTSYILKWIDDDPDSDATISLYYDSNHSGEDGMLIVSGLGEDLNGTGGEYAWDTSVMVEGSFYIYAVIDDGSHDPIVDYSDGPLTIDRRPLHFSEFKLTASDGAEDDGFGSSVAIYGNYAIAGSPYHDDGDDELTGSAYIFERQGDTWLETAKLTASDSRGWDFFGYSVAINGDYAVVGADGTDVYFEGEGYGIFNGASYVFKREGTKWTQMAKLTASDPIDWGFFGRSVDISGDTIIVGASKDPSEGGNIPGAAYIFRRFGLTWKEQAILRAGDGTNGNLFGQSVSIDGDYAVVGAPHDSGDGAAYVFKREGESWGEQAKLLSSDHTYQEDAFGYSVSVKGDSIIVGDQSRDAAYVFERDGSSWIEQEKITASDKAFFFGNAVAMDQGYSIVGTLRDWGLEDGSPPNAAYIFRQKDAAWNQEDRIVSSDVDGWDFFGGAVDLSGGYAIIGAVGDDDEGEDSGSAYVYSVSPVHMSADQEIIASGDSTSLTWNCPGAQSVSLDNGIGSVSSEGSLEISPTETTIYTVTAVYPWDTYTYKVTVMVIYPPTAILNAAPLKILAGQPTTLMWDTTGADTVTIDQGIGEVDPNGTLTLSPAQTTTFTLLASNEEGTTEKSVEVEVLVPLEDVDLGLSGDEQEGGGGLVGGAVRLLNGNGLEYRSDLAFPSPHTHGLVLGAFYNSRASRTGGLGFGWSHTYEATLKPSVVLGGFTVLQIADATGRVAYFQEGIPGEYSGVFGETSRVKLEAAGYVWHRQDGSKYCFLSSGRLTWIDDAVGNRLQMAYDTNDRLEAVTDAASGRILTFHYEAGGLLDHICGPVTEAVSDGIWVSYGYDGNQNLISVSYADGSGYDYAFTDSVDIHNLTEKKNRADHILMTWGYDSRDRVVTLFDRDGTGMDLDYHGDDQVKVTDAYGKEREYTLSTAAGRKRVSSVTCASGPVGGIPYVNSRAVSWLYDDLMRLTGVEYAGGTFNQYLDHDERGNPGTVVLASSTPGERTLVFTYHPEISVPLTRTEPSVLGGGDKETIWDYDDDYDAEPNEDPKARISRLIERGYTKDATGAVVAYEYVTTYTYNAKGRVLSIDGPKSGSEDTTAFSYDPATGDLLTITRPIVGATTFSDYDAAGKPGLLTDINEQTREYTYDGKGRITDIINNADNGTSQRTYNFGLLDSRIDEDLVITGFEYETVNGRLAKRVDQEGNYIAYGYDGQGNLVEKSYHDPSDIRTNRKRYLYQDPSHDMPGKLYRELNPDNTYTQYGYDEAGNVASVTDPRGYTAVYDYDSLNRLTGVVHWMEPGSGDDVSVSYSYDGQGNLTTVTDGESHTTTYEYDDMGRMVTAVSPDAGMIQYAYDEAGNLVDKTDGKGITVTYVYDDLNRLIATHFPDASQDIVRTYDQGTNGMGRLTGITDPSGEMAFKYDARGRMITKNSLINAQTYSISRGFTPGGRILSFTYPTGRTVDFDRAGCACTVNKISTTYNSDTVTLMETVAYRPYGVATGMDTGAGSSIINEFDDSGRLSVINPGKQTERFHGYDGNGNLTSLQVTHDTLKSMTYEYDGFSRLKKAYGRFRYFEYTYDKAGNRISRRVNSHNETYSYLEGTNRVDKVTGENTVSFSYDDNGNIVGMGDRVFTFSQNNRLIKVEEGDTILGEYTYNGLGQRVIKEVDGTVTVYHYDFDGNLIAESDGIGNFSREYLYDKESRLALVDAQTEEVYFYVNDNLGTPQVITDADGKSVWEALYKPFGSAGIHPESSVVNNFRFPGQYFDEETGFHYNYHRYYDPRTGRYLTPDPLNVSQIQILKQSSTNRLLRLSPDPFFFNYIQRFFNTTLLYHYALITPQGLNLYPYVQNNPVNWMDPLGLLSKGDIINWAGSVGSVVAREGGLISVELASKLSIVASVLGELIDPRSLNAGEERLLEHYRTMKEIDELNIRIRALEDKLEPMLDKLEIPYDWDDDNHCE